MSLARVLPGVLALALLASAAEAHGTAWSIGGSAVAVEFHYTTDEPMAYAAVTIQAPDKGAPFQTGRTDAQGHFAFVPDRDGNWDITADDGMGHVARATAPVALGRTAAVAADPFAASVLHGQWPLRTLLGLSLLGNLGLAAVLRRRPPTP